MKIGELAELSAVTAKTIRYYEQIGLLPSPRRHANGYRSYCRADLDRLVFIRRCRDLQIPLEHIKHLSRALVDKSSSCEAIDQMVGEHLQKVRTALAELALLEESLSELAQPCRGKVVSECEVLSRLRTST